MRTKKRKPLMDRMRMKSNLDEDKKRNLGLCVEEKKLTSRCDEEKKRNLWGM
jgi:hypothetical protein